MRIDKHRILEEIKRTAQVNNGVPLGVARFSQETGIKETDWAGKFWARWGDALREAGFEPNPFNAAYDTTLLIEKFIFLMRDLGKFPVRRELLLKARTDNSFPSANVFARFGSKQQFAAEILDYCKSRTGYEDVMALCTPIAARLVEHQESENSVDGLTTHPPHKRFATKNTKGEWFSLYREDVEAFKRRKFM